jgi:DNA-binding NarL/FixJ family response regulator
VLDLIAAGLSNAQITARLVLSPKTVRNHISSIFGKPQVTDRSQAVIRAFRTGIVEPPQIQRSGVARHRRVYSFVSLR